MSEDKETRRWLLQGYAGKDKVHESTCHGDRALNDAHKRLEAVRHGDKPLRIVVTRAR